jgi:hypothetical protein
MVSELFSMALTSPSSPEKQDYLTALLMASHVSPACFWIRPRPMTVVRRDHQRVPQIRFAVLHTATTRQGVPSDFTVCCDQRRAEPNFSGTSEPSPRDVYPENHGNPSSRTAKRAGRQPRHHSVRASKPMRLYPDRRIRAGCCYNRLHTWDNKRSCPASQAVSLRLEAPIRTVAL